METSLGSLSRDTLLQRRSRRSVSIICKPKKLLQRISQVLDDSSRILYEQQHHFLHKVRGAFILQLLELQELIIQQALAKQSKQASRKATVIDDSPAMMIMMILHSEKMKETNK